MINFEELVLENGLKVVIHEDRSTPMIAVNILYDVGSKDEPSDKTGFAHLFEHLMFGGSQNVPDFDQPIQLAGGENNAFTNSDITNFYDIVPSDNVETVLWVESDRMKHLDVSKKALEIQRKVVVEEFKETCLNQPYGDVWHHLSALAYQQHPYQWPTIGAKMEHIADAKIEDVQSFYEKYYGPNNAILVLAGNISYEEGKRLAEKWFGDIPPKARPQRNYQAEPQQNEARYKNIISKVPLESGYLGFHMPGRLDPNYYACDLLSDLLSYGRSSRFYQNLYKETQLFEQIDAYISGSSEPGLFIIEYRLQEGKDYTEAKNLIWEEIELFKNEGITKKELQKVKNKVQSGLLFSEVNILNRAISLAYFAALDNTALINQQIEKYQAVTIEDVLNMANQILTPKNCSEIRYSRQQ